MLTKFADIFKNNSLNPINLFQESAETSGVHRK